MKQTAVEWLIETMYQETYPFNPKYSKIFKQAKEMEKKQLFLASKTSAKEAYKAGQQTMHCGCYEISDALTYEEWLYETFKSE
jgi:predicted TIM-barrel fold metal-dependent hydrolase